MATVSIGAIKPVRWPALWFGGWVLAMVLVVTTCLLPGEDLPKVAEGMDKLEHAGAFAVLAAWAVQLFATRRALLRAAAWLVILGVLIELLQGWFTADRTPDAIDALADASGVLLGLLVALTPARDLLLRWFPRRSH
ncbi:VanZ family protein [Pseudoxanthomonas spadix]|uniref:VanZ family protein n=1 Tax=Pseudoxanthomonas spadix TaxID=415229 RepID=UPI0005BA1EBD|nr:VanZ family protein [Pseudoxanthomonas spadix]MBP3975688.1 VanZ family protein [Pseudoxanthomonas spadix]RMW92009.1 VanZ family protein [Pseudoxanthomonas spadix]